MYFTKLEILQQEIEILLPEDAITAAYMQQIEAIKENIDEVAKEHKK